MRNADFLEKGTSGLLKESHGSGGGQSAYRQEDPKKERQYLHTGFQAIFSTFDEGIVYVDGAALEEPYIREPTYTAEGTEFPLTVPEGSVFVMGDNRNGSSDSRDYRLGTVDTRYVIGKAAVLIFPGPDSETEKRDFKRIGVLSGQAGPWPCRVAD